MARKKFFWPIRSRQFKRFWNWFGKSKCPGARLDLTVNFHHEHFIDPTNCPWVSEDGQYDEHISQVQIAQNELQIQSTKQLAQITDLQSQLNTANRDNEASKRQLETLKQQLEHRDADYRNEVSRSRIELDSERKTQAELRDKISDLEDKISDMSQNHKDGISLKDNQLELLNEQLRAKENDIKRIHDEEMKKAELLEKAIYSYASSTKNASRPVSPYRT